MKAVHTNAVDNEYSYSDAAIFLIVMNYGLVTWIDFNHCVASIIQHSGATTSGHVKKIAERSGSLINT